MFNFGNVCLVLCFQGQKGSKGDPGQKVKPSRIGYVTKLTHIHTHTFLKFSVFCVVI